eukprot:6202162-Pleurochrysis_carterae.AAC.8
MRTKALSPEELARRLIHLALRRFGTHRRPGDKADALAVTVVNALVLQRVNKQKKKARPSIRGAQPASQSLSPGIESRTTRTKRQLSTPRARQG